MSWQGNTEALLSALVAGGRETAIPILGAGRYINDMAYGQADASSARDWAREQLSGLSYQPQDTSGQEAAYGGLAEALQGAQKVYDSGAFGVKSLANSDLGAALYDKAKQAAGKVSEDTWAGLDMATGAMDVIPMGAALGAFKVASHLPMDEASDFAKLMAKRRVLDDYENDIDFVQADTIDYTIDSRLGKRMPSGKYRGSPHTIDSPTKLKGMRKRLAGLLESGAPGRLWYDESSESANQLTGGRRNYKHLNAGATAITSRGAFVPVNAGFAAKGFNQAIAGHAADTGRFPTSQGSAIDTLRSGQKYEGGPKETPFYEALTIDERPEGVRPTNDLWMARAFGYEKANPRFGKNKLIKEKYIDDKGRKKTRMVEGTEPEDEFVEWSEGLGAAQHRFMDNEVNALVKVANESKLGGVDDWTPERVQAAIWVAIKAEKEGTTVEAASRNFANGLDNITATMRFGTKPSTSLDHLSGVSASDDYADVHRTALQDPEGRDRLALQLGMQTRPSVPGHGQWMQQTEPSTAMRVLAGQETGSPVADKSSEALLTALAATRGLTEGQDVVPWTMRRPNSSQGVMDTQYWDPLKQSQQKKDGTYAPGNATPRLDKKGQQKGHIMENIASIDIGRTPTPEALVELNQQLTNQFGTTDIFAVHTDNGVEILNTSKISTDEFRDGVRKVSQSLNPEFGYNSGRLVGNTDWGNQGYKPSAYMREIDGAGLEPNAINRLEAGAKDEALTLMKVDALIEKEVQGAGKVDPMLTLTREILGTAGFQGIRDAVAKGILPVAILGLVGLSGGGNQPSGQQPAF